MIELIELIVELLARALKTSVMLILAGSLIACGSTPKLTEQDLAAAYHQGAIDALSAQEDQTIDWEKIERFKRAAGLYSDVKTEEVPNE